MSEVLAVGFDGGFDDTHNPRHLLPGSGVRCIDLDLRFGRFQPRPDLYPFRMDGLNLTIQAPIQLAFSCYSANGDQLLFIAAGDGKLKVVKGLTFENMTADTPASYPSYTSIDDVIDRDTDAAVELQTTEPMEWARFGDVIYICNAGAAAGTEKDWSTLKLNLQDIKAELLLEEDWPKSRHIENYLHYAVIGDLSGEGQRTILSTDLPLVGANAVTWLADNVDEPATDPDDRVMRLVYNGKYLLAFFKRTLFRYVGAPTHWRANRLLDIGTLSPQSVEFLNGNVYFLGSDGIPRRTNGEEMVAEKVGAFDYQGKMKHIDGRSPVETGLRSYKLGSAAASAASATFRWDSKLDFDGQAAYTYSEYRVGNDECVGGVHPVRIQGAEEYSAGRPSQRPIPTESQYDIGEGDCWQSFRLDNVAANVAVSKSHLAHECLVLLTFPSTGDHLLHLYFLQHTDTTKKSYQEVLIKKVDLTYDAPVTGFQWVHFPLDDIRMADDISDYSDPPTNGAKYRIAVTKDEFADDIQWGNDPAAGYSRGSSSISQAAAYGFHYYAYRYDRQHTIPFTLDVAVHLMEGIPPLFGNAIPRSGRTWRDVTFKTHIFDEDSTHATATVYLTSEPFAATGWKEVPVSGININSLFDDPPDYIRWRVVLSQDEGYGGDHAALESIAISLTSADAADDPAAIAWDGRYCLSLKRTGVTQRDIYVWDRDAWSRWENVGFLHAAIMDDTVNRRRLVTVDHLANSVGAPSTRAICVFLAEAIRTGWRSLVPKFQTGVLTLASLQVASLSELAAIYNEAVGSIAGKSLMIQHRLDSEAWVKHNIALDGPLSPIAFPPRTSRESLSNDEGRHIELLVGGEQLNPVTGDVLTQNPGVEVDAIYIDSEVVGPRRGHHTGAS